MAIVLHNLRERAATEGAAGSKTKLRKGGEGADIILLSLLPDGIGGRPPKVSPRYVRH